MDSIFDIATSVSTPLALGGFLAAVVFFIFRQVIAKDIFPQLTDVLGADIIRRIIDRLFILALVTTVLGIGAYAYIKTIGEGPIPSIPHNAFSAGNGDIFVRTGANTWNEISPPRTDPSFTFEESGRTSDELLLYDKSRDMHVRFPIPSGTATWRVGESGPWTNWYVVTYHK
ncbi:hypothetical protein [Paraburkholderia sp. BL23I1N1]|uniref:hypothetical protein n=1 Tax=Paraburkholderia sp. BL23I1N1 TaxID=1938802 RepID=UPI0011C41347|nr:hypothetical protein [Paraburkholderia sp. BL23I1N1]